MFSKRKKYKDLDFINNTAKVNIMPKLRQNPKINDLIQRELKPDSEVQTEKFKRPNTPEEYKAFHKTNEDGIKKAYEASEGYFKDGNKLYIAGTKDIADVLDWGKLVAGDYKNSKIYKNADEVIKNNPDIDTVIGHSAGGSAALELEKNHTDRHIDSVTYNAPVFSPWSAEQYIDKTKTPMRFALAFDPITLLDMNAQTTFHAPDLNFDLVKDAVKMAAEPNFDNGKAVFNDLKNTDPLLGLHAVNHSYSEPSSAMDYLKVAGAAVATASELGII